MSHVEAEASDDCPACDCGMYCDSPGLTAPRGQCDPGFLCYGGAYTSGPTDGVTGDFCTAGGYCEAGKLTTLIYNILNISSPFMLKFTVIKNQ